MDIIEDILSETPTVPIFHYTSQQGLLGIIKSKTIWATNIRYLNDATEFAYAVELAQRKILEIKQTTSTKVDIDLLERINSRLESIEEANIFVCSFSEDGNLLSQWRAYCPNANGFSIGFEYSQLQGPMDRQSFKLVKCIYDYAIHTQIIRQLILKSIETFHTKAKLLNENSGAEDAAKEFVSKFFQISPMLKDSSFSEEKEWRLISDPIPVNNPQVRFREGKSMIIPYFEFKLVKEDEHLSIRRIFIGPTPHNNLSNGSVRDLLFANGVKSWEIRLSRIPYRGW